MKELLARSAVAEIRAVQFCTHHPIFPSKCTLLSVSLNQLINGRER